MKTSLRKLGGFGLQKHQTKERLIQKSLSQLDELAQATQDMQDMRDCYDTLLSAAAVTTNSAYEFSESLQQLGDCLLEKTALNDDEESGEVLLMLGKVQLELQKLMDNYRSHVSQTITIPSESLLKELRTVEEMKTQCDEKRSLYEDMIARIKEKGRLRSTKGESISSHQLQEAYNNYDMEASLFVFRMKSLKGGQSRSLLTQAARHHAAQLSFFRKALGSLEAIEPNVKRVTEQHHIDYQFIALEDDNHDDDYDTYSSADSDYEARDDGELSFDYGLNNQGKDVSTSSNSMELDDTVELFPQVATTVALKENLDKNHVSSSFLPVRVAKTSSKSAPLFPEKKIDPAERFSQFRQSSARKWNTYVLPTPVMPKNQVSSGSYTQVLDTRQRSPIQRNNLNIWHSSPFEQKKNEKILRNDKLPGLTILNPQLVPRVSNSDTKSSPLPPPPPTPRPDILSSYRLEPHAASDAKRIKIQAFSGPLPIKSWKNRGISTASGPFFSTETTPQLFSGPVPHTRLPRPSSSPKPSTSTTYVSSPKISELHELPRPPAHLAHPNLVGHSVPLGSKSPSSAASAVAVAHTFARSHSIASGSQQETASGISRPLEAPPRNSKMVEDYASPPLTPICLLIKPATSTTTKNSSNPASQPGGS